MLASARSEFQAFRGEVATGPVALVHLSGVLFLASIVSGAAGINSQAIGGFWQVVKTQSRILVPSDLALVPGVKIAGVPELNNEL